MNSKSITSYTVIALISFVLAFSFLQSILFNYEKDEITMSIQGRSLKGLKAFYSNKYTKDTPLDATKRTQEEYTFKIPAYIYIKRIKLSLDYDSSLEIHTLKFIGQNNSVKINSNDFKTFLRLKNCSYNEKNRVIEVNKNYKNKNNKIIISSIDLSNFVKILYKKRLSSKYNILISLIFSICTTILFNIMFLKFKRNQLLYIVLPTIVISLSLTFIYKIIATPEFNREILSEDNIFNIIQPHTTNNLIYNGDFRYGLLFWGYDSDSTIHQLVDTPFGKGVKITRSDGDEGNWSLRYLGRPILYHKNHTYIIKFKYKIIKGQGIPFNIGWWINRGNPEYGTHRLRIEVNALKNNWYNAEVKYKFKRDYENLYCILNCLKDYSEVLIADIQINDIDNEINQLNFVDQLNNNE